MYVIWFVLRVAVVARRWSLALLALAVGPTQVRSEGRYHEVTRAGAIVEAVLARDLVLYVLVVAAARCHTHTPRSAIPTAHSVNSSGRLA